MTQESPQGPAGDTAGVIAPPVLIYALGIAAGFALDYAMPYPVFPQPVRIALGGLLMAAGGVCCALAYLGFRRAGTDSRPWKPTTAFVAKGLYRFSRNPMYVSFTAIHLGLAVVADAPWVLATLPPVLVVMHYGVILREERYLERLFGEDYHRYRATVRRWV